MIKCIFHLRETAIDTVYGKHILLISRSACCRILTWWNLKGLAELANLTVYLSLAMFREILLSSLGKVDSYFSTIYSFDSKISYIPFVYTVLV